MWTGTEMIVSGKRYNPSTNSWRAMSTTNAPRGGGTAVWTGTEMIVWGGLQDTGISSTELTGTGGRYNPVTDTWITTQAGAPTARDFDSAIWTGAEMILWGGQDWNPYETSVGYTRTGARYSPATDSWTPTSIVNAPTPRVGHAAFWSGNEMIIYGGFDGFRGVNTGGRYNPGTDSWTVTSTINAPTHGGSSVVWTGNEMIVWGGGDLIFGNYFNTGARYNPGTDSWIATSTTNAPSARGGHSAVWTGTEMIVWGGNTAHCPDPVNGCVQVTYFSTGGKYNPVADTWLTTSTSNAPSGRAGEVAIWTGSDMII